MKEALKLRADKTVAVCLDIMGPEIRTSKHKDDAPIQLKKDYILKISIDSDLEGDADGIGCNYEMLLNHTRLGKLVYIQDGAVTGTIAEIGDVSVRVYYLILGLHQD